MSQDTNNQQPMNYWDAFQAFLASQGFPHPLPFGSQLPPGRGFPLGMLYNIPNNAPIGPQQTYPFNPVFPQYTIAGQAVHQQPGSVPTSGPPQRASGNTGVSQPSSSPSSSVNNRAPGDIVLASLSELASANSTPKNVGTERRESYEAARDRREGRSKVRGKKNHAYPSSTQSAQPIALSSASSKRVIIVICPHSVSPLSYIFVKQLFTCK